MLFTSKIHDSLMVIMFNKGMAMTLNQLEQYIVAEVENLHLKIDSEIEKLHARMDSFEGRIDRLEAKMDTWFEKLSAQIARSAPKHST